MHVHMCVHVLFFFFWGMYLIHNLLLKRGERVCEEIERKGDTQFLLAA